MFGEMLESQIFLHCCISAYGAPDLPISSLNKHQTKVADCNLCFIPREILQSENQWLLEITWVAAEKHLVGKGKRKRIDGENKGMEKACFKETGEEDKNGKKSDF